MTQGVYIEDWVEYDELPEFLERHPGLVHVRHESGYPARFVLLLTRAQLRERQSRDRTMTMVLGSPPSGPPVSLLDDILQRLRPRDDSRPMYLSCFRRPATKRSLRQAVKDDPATVFLEETSEFGNEYEGPLSEAPGRTYAVVGPDPARKRTWFASIRWSGAKRTWSVD